MNSNDLLIMVPEWFQRVIEYPEIMKAWAYALNQVDGNIRRLWDNQYIQTCDEATLALYEKVLGIILSGYDTLEYRRMVVLNKYSMLVPFTESFLREKLDGMFGSTGYIFTINSAACTASITITAPVARSVNLFFNLWYQIAPAHIKADAHAEAQSVLTGDQYYGAVIISSVNNRI